MKKLAKKWTDGQEADLVIGVAYDWNKRILVVDDEPAIRETYNDILCPPTRKTLPLRSSRSAASKPPNETDPGFEFDVTVCESFEEALKAFRAAMAEGRPYVMGFFDVMLGSAKDGYDLVKEMHSHDPDLYAVFVTAYNDRSIESINSLLGSKMVDRWDYINKPFSQGEILQKARNFVTLWNLEKESELKSNQLAEAQDRLLLSERTAAVAAVARGVTHEFGNILMQIMGKADLARKKNEAEMRRALETIVEASQHASDILEKFKNLSTTDESIGRHDWVFVHNILEEALDLLDHQFKTTNMKVSIVKKDVVKIKASATSLLQVLINLSINAIHAMGTSGQIDFSIILADPWVEVRVRDYGPGIRTDLMEKVLEPFFTTKGKNGTGLGLSICREIIEIEHRGTLSLKNHPVKGLEAIIRLPINGGDLDE